MSRRRAILAVRSHAARQAQAAQEDQGAADVAPDHDETPEDLDRDALAAEYERIFDKPPHGRMKTETIRDRIADHDDAE